jgi:membrane-associated protease RseP (regulator of RpoE activity)
LEPTPIRYRSGEPLPPPPEEYKSLLTNHSPPERDRYWLHALLFAATVATTIWAGGQWAGRMALWEETGFALFLDPAFLADGLRYAIPFLLFLTVHEFGHYLTARAHRVDVSLPYYIPIPPGVPILNIGTFGAVIRIRQRIGRTRQLFDIGVAGPLAGFVIALGALIYALVTLPPPTYILDLGPGHEAIQEYVLRFGTFPAVPPVDEFGIGPLAVGDTPLFALLRLLVPDIPPGWEMYHYPVLFAGWLGLFFTALNMLPVGQLDGGHVTYSLFGERWHGRLARATVLLLLFSGGLGAVSDIGPLARLAATEAGRPGWIGLAITWFVITIFIGWITRRLFASGYHRTVAWLGLIVVIALADAIGGISGAVGWSGWLLWSALIVFVIRVDHPPVVFEEPLTPGRRAMGILALILFVLCFSPRPIYFVT